MDDPFIWRGGTKLSSDSQADLWLRNIAIIYKVAPMWKHNQRSKQCTDKQHQGFNLYPQKKYLSISVKVVLSVIISVLEFNLYSLNGLFQVIS